MPQSATAAQTFRFLFVWILPFVDYHIFAAIDWIATRALGYDRSMEIASRGRRHCSAQFAPEFSVVAFPHRRLAAAICGRSRHCRRDHFQAAIRRLDFRLVARRARFFQQNFALLKCANFVRGDDLKVEPDGGFLRLPADKFPNSAMRY